MATNPDTEASETDEEEIDVMKTTIKLMKRFCNDESGAAAAEYVLILAIIGAGIAVAAVALGGAISSGMNAASTCITTNGNTC